MAWAAIVALLRDRFNANEILVSLMLVYVAEQLLNYLVYGPWKDPHGYNFPQTITFVAVDPAAAPGAAARASTSASSIALVARRGVLGVPVPHLRAASSCRSAGWRRRRRATPASRRARRCGRRCCVSGGMAGLAGALEVAGPLGQLTPHVSAGLRLRRDHRRLRRPAASGRLVFVGVLLMSMFYIGGELGAVAARPAESR